MWDADSGQCLATLLGHNDEVLDVCFNYTGQLIATASADGETSPFQHHNSLISVHLIQSHNAVLLPE